MVGATFADIAGGYYIYLVALLVCILIVIRIKQIVVPYDDVECPEKEEVSHV